MNRLIEIVKEGIKDVEQLKGISFDIKCLVANSNEDIHWDLILSAEWFNNLGHKEILDYLYDKIVSKFDTDCIVHFSALRTINKEHRLFNILKKIQDNHGNENDYTLVNNPIDDYAKIVIPLNFLKK